MTGPHSSQILAWIVSNHSVMIARIARKELRGIQTLEADDVEQQIYLELGQRAYNPETGKGTDFTTWNSFGIADLATKIARNYVARERIEYMHFAGAFVYTPKIVEAFLKQCVWVELEDVPDIDGRVDVVAAVKELDLQTQRELFQTFGLDQPFGSKTAEYKRVERAIEGISNRLNQGSGVKIGDLADAA